MKYPVANQLVKLIMIITMRTYISSSSSSSRGDSNKSVIETRLSKCDSDSRERVGRMTNKLTREGTMMMERDEGLYTP